MISEQKITAIQEYRTGQICNWLALFNCAAIILFDPVNIRYATGSRNMQVWTMHNLCRYAVVFQSGKTVMFELPGSRHLSEGLGAIDSIRPAITADYMAVAHRTKELAGRWAQEICDLLKEEQIGTEEIAIDRADLELVLASQQQNINLVDGKSVMERARSIKSVEEVEALKWSLSTCE